MESLNNEQKQFVVDNEFQYRKLYGVPGGGKTKCIIEKLCYLQQTGFVHDWNDYLVLTFSRQSCEDLLKKGKARNKTLFHNKSIRTIHSTCSSILYHYKSDSYMNIATLIYECVEWLEKEGLSESLITDRIWSSKKIILVDEAQDISELQYRFISTLGKLYNCPVILVGDPNQTIFQFQNGTDKFLLQHPGEALYLKYNYRSNSSIVSFLNHFRPWETYGHITAHNGEGKKPMLFLGGVESCLLHLWKRIISSTCGLHEMAIIAPVKLSHTYCLSLSIITNYLDQMNIPFVKHYQDSDWDHSYKKVREISPGKINLFTIHASKGLEFKKVFLCNFHFNTKVYTPTKEEFLENRYLWYVGLSRAMEEMYIYGLSESVLFPTIYNCPTELYKCNTLVIEKTHQFSKHKSDKHLYHSIKNFITTKTILDEDKLYELHKLFQYEMKTEELFHVDVELYEYESYSIIYGSFMDDWMFFKTVPLESYIHSKKRWFEVKIPLPKELWKYIKVQMKQKKQLHYYSDFVNYMNPESLEDKEILKIIQDTLECKNDYFEFCLDNHVCEYHQRIYHSYLEKLYTATTLLEKIELVWNVVLFQYQLDFECKYLLHKDFSNHWITVLPYIEKIDEIKTFNRNTLFQIPIIDPEIHLKGVMDALDDKNVIYEFKFCQEITLHSHIQLFLYSLIHYSSLENKTVELWNLQKGKRYITTFTKDTSEDIRDYIKMLFLKEQA